MIVSSTTSESEIAEGNMAKKTAKTKTAKKAKNTKRKSKPQVDPSPNGLEFRAMLMEKDEPLRPDLRKYVELGGSDLFRARLVHPLLVTAVNPNRAAYIHWFIDRKQKEMEEYRRNGKWIAVLECYATAYLVDGFCSECKRFDDTTFWEALAFVWTELEEPWPNRKLLLTLFTSPRPERRNLMRPEEHRAFAKLPDSLEIYRGFIGRRGKGLSWTCNKDKAIWFANRFAMIQEKGKPRIRSGVAKKADVLAYFTRRKEAEIVIDPNKVKRQKTTDVGGI